MRRPAGGAPAAFGAIRWGPVRTQEETRMPPQPRSLSGLNAAVTGGARGIGRATAQAFVREGMKVAIGDLDLGAARQTATELGTR